MENQQTCELEILWKRFQINGDYNEIIENFAVEFNYSTEFVQKVLDELIDASYDKAFGSWQ